MSNGEKRGETQGLVQAEVAYVWDCDSLARSLQGAARPDVQPAPGRY